MAKTTIISFLVFFVVQGCSGGSETAGDTYSDPDGAAQDADGEGVDADAGTETDAGRQGPVTFVVANATGDPLFFLWGTGGNNTVTAEFESGGTFEHVLFWPSFCFDSCEGCICVLRCAVPARMKQVDPAGELRFDWNGDSMVILDSELCGCSCNRLLDVREGHYTANVCAWTQYECQGECTPDAEGIINGAAPVGDPLCIETAFDIPYGAPELVLEFQ